MQTQTSGLTELTVQSRGFGESLSDESIDRPDRADMSLAASRLFSRYNIFSKTRSEKLPAAIDVIELSLKSSD